MRAPGRLPHPRRLSASIMMAASLSACTHWQVQSVSPQQLLSERKPNRIRVTLTDREEVVLRQPQIVKDSLYGVRSSSTPQPGGRAREAVALADVDHVAIRKTDPLATTLLLVPAAAVVAQWLGGSQLQPRSPKTQSIADHRYGAEAHRGCGNHRT